MPQPSQASDGPLRADTHGCHPVGIVRIAAILLGAALAFASPVGAEERSGVIDEGHPGYPFYRQYCASCHGLWADGLGPVVPALRSRPPDLTRGAEFEARAP